MNNESDTPCISTHGACGFAPGTYRKPDGKMVCGACGVEFDLPEQYRDRPLPDYVGGCQREIDMRESLEQGRWRWLFRIILLLVIVLGFAGLVVWRVICCG